MESLNTLTLPEINISKQDEWDFISKPQEESMSDNNTTENETIGLTRALSLPRQLNEDSVRTEVINISTSNPSHLFWVPASQHPEIAPTEFEKYVNAHGLIIRKKSVKRHSVLSVYFTASDQLKLSEDIKESIDTDRQQALNALEKKNEQHEIKNDEEDKKRKKMLRRSQSLHLPSTADFARNVPDLLVFDRNSSPYDESRALVPKGDRPLLRRGARTNFKRNSTISPHRHSSIVNRKSIDKEQLPRSNSTEGITLVDTDAALDQPIDESKPLSPLMEATDQVRELSVSSRKESEAENGPINTPPEPLIVTRSMSTLTNQSRKSNWSWAFWSDEKSSKKPSTTVEEPIPEKSVTTDAIRPSKSIDSNKRFTFSSLFSRKPKQPTNYIEQPTANFAPKNFELKPKLMTRLPLHVERAIYKLSHIKLANPRRPLHEQVLISNHMFWYLSIIATQHPIVEEPKPKPAPRKRLVKKQTNHKKIKPNHKVTNFMSNQSTGFVVPENYLNPQKAQSKPTLNKSKPYNRQQSSDSSSDEEEDDDQDTKFNSDEEDEDENILINRKYNVKDDDLPLAMYKTNSQKIIK